MTTPPSDSFDYTDDSVIARVSFDVPSQAISDVTQLTQAMSAMRTQLEAIARAQENWLDYLGQVPEITERANQMMREHITLLERASYVQNEIGVNRYGSGTGNVGGVGTAGGGGSGSYSTAAPMGYGAGPFAGQTLGMGRNMSEQEVAEKVAQSAASDPGLAANMQSARGVGVNPALLGMIGAGVNKMFGRGKGPASANTPQKTTSQRNSAAEPDDEMGGAPSSADDPDESADPHPNSPVWQKLEAIFGKADKENRAGKNNRLRDMAGSIGEMIGGKIGGKATAGIGKAIGDRIGAMASSPAGMATGALALGGLGFSAAQRIGEGVTNFQQLGSVQGGDYMTGMKYEAQARIMALNPFITTEQARQAMQLALREGFRGDNYDTVQDFMIQNFKELGISMGQSMDIMKSQVRGMSEDESQAGVRGNLDQALNTMKELSAEGGLSFPERADQLQQVSEIMKGMGFSSENVTRTALGLQEGYGDSMSLRDEIGRIGGQVLASDSLVSMAGIRAGITGSTPAATRVKLERAGYDGDEIVEMVAAEVAGYVSGFEDPIDRIANFMDLMKAYGVDLDFPQAQDLYNKVTGSEKPTAKANRVIERQGRTRTGGGSNPPGSRSQSSNPADSEWNKDHQNYTGSTNAGGISENFADAGRGSGNFSPTSNPAPPLPSGPTTNASFTTLKTEGILTGNVTITVDQSGRVSAPPVIQLTGQNKTVNAGYGSATANNPSPADPNYNHSNSSSFPSGGGR